MHVYKAVCPYYVTIILNSDHKPLEIQGPNDCTWSIVSLIIGFTVINYKWLCRDSQGRAYSLILVGVPYSAWYTLDDSYKMAFKFS